MEKQLQYNKQFSPRNKLKQKNSGEQSLHSQIYQNNNFSNQSQNSIDDCKKIVQSQPVQYKAKKKSNINTNNTNDSQGQNNTSNNINTQSQKLPNLILQKDPVKIELKNKMEQQSELINKLKKQIERSPRVGNLKEMEQKMDLIRTKKGFLPRQRSAETATRRKIKAEQDYFQQTQKPITSANQNQNNLYQNFLNKQKEQVDIKELYEELNKINNKQMNKNNISEFYNLLPQHLKQFFSQKTHFQKVFQDYDITNYCLMEVNEKIKCYRYELGIFVERVGSSYFQIIENLLNSSIQLHDDLKKKYENQIKENLEMINKLVSEKKELEGSIRKLKSQNIVSENLYKITKINSDSLQTEVQMLSDLLKKDIQSMVNHLGDVEKYQQEQKEKLLSNNKASDPTEKLMSGLDDLNNMIDTLSVEHKSKDNFLNTMNGLLKAMLKGTKKDAFTQVDEGELIWSPNQIYISDFQNIPYPSDLTSLGINLGNTNYQTIQPSNNIEAIKMKEKELISSQTHQKKFGNSQSENWNLPVTLIVFLENISKTNESGRVIPWFHFRKMIFDVYKDYIKNQWEINGNLMSTCISMDEYLCIYMLKQHKLRRIAENKLFEFLVSLRYYSKIQPRALIFASLCKIISLSNHNGQSHNSEYTFNYKFDIYLQNYFMYLFRKSFQDLSKIQETESQTFINKQKADSVAEHILKINIDNSKTKYQNKITKLQQKNQETDPQDSINLDGFFDIMIEEFFDARKKITKSFIKEFQKIQAEEVKLYSFDSLKLITKEIMGKQSFFNMFSYPSDITLARIFLYTLTSDKNKYEILSKEFFTSCSRFGFDSPFPSIRLQYQEQNQVENKGQFPEDANLMFQNISNQMNNGMQFVNQNVNYLDQQNQLKIDTSSSLFAQHFSILRELRNYVKQFKDSYQKQEETQVLWEQFQNIINILDTGCQFLNFPINV